MRCSAAPLSLSTVSSAVVNAVVGTAMSFHPLTLLVTLAVSQRPPRWIIDAICFLVSLLSRHIWEPGGSRVGFTGRLSISSVHLAWSVKRVAGPSRGGVSTHVLALIFYPSLPPSLVLIFVSRVFFLLLLVCPFLLAAMKADGTGGSNGACMRMSPEKDWGANAGLHVARDFVSGE